MLNLNDLVNVTVTLSGLPAAREGFSTACLCGASTVISPQERLRLYPSAAAMLEDGFTDECPEYQAALVYFAQSSKPSQVLIGRIDLETGETWAQACTACLAASQDFYMFCPCAVLTAEEIVAVAAVMEAENRVFAFSTADEACLSGGENVFSVLKDAGYARTIGLYSTVPHAAAALCGFAMGANDGTAGSAFTLCYKSLAAVAPDEVTAAQLSAVHGANGNAYVRRAGVYATLEKGVMADGEHFDTRLGVDQLVSNIRLAVTDLLCNTKTKVPQTETGMTQIKAAIAAECEKAVKTGFLGDGVWTEADVLNLKTGDAIPGYRVLSESVDIQTEAERASRAAPPIYVALKLSGAVESVVVKLIVDR